MYLKNHFIDLCKIYSIHSLAITLEMFTFVADHAQDGWIQLFHIIDC